MDDQSHAVTDDQSHAVRVRESRAMQYGYVSPEPCMTGRPEPCYTGRPEPCYTGTGAMLHGYRSHATRVLATCLESVLWAHNGTLRNSQDSLIRVVSQMAPFYDWFMTGL